MQRQHNLKHDMNTMRCSLVGQRTTTKHILHHMILFFFVAIRAGHVGWRATYGLIFRRYELATLVGVLEEFDGRQPLDEQRFYWLDIVTVDQNFDGAPPPFQW